MDRGGFQGYRNTNSNSNSTAAGLKLTDMKMNNNSNNGGSSSSNNSTPPPADDGECTVREQDRFMPIANVIRIMRKILPPHAKISDDAKETIQECVSEYISFITGEANERCQREQRKTITAEDVLWAMSKLGFDDYIEPLTVYLHRYREMEGDRGAIRGDPLVKRPSSAMDFGTQLGFAFGPAAAFHMGHPNGFLGAAAMGGYIKDAAAGAGSSQAAAVANGQANGQCK